MATLRKNIGANYAGKMWLALMSLAFVPVYIHFMGMEAYGLVGVFLSLQSLFALLDLGLSTTLNRELARLTTEPGHAHAQEMRDLLQTLQIIYWGVAFLIGFLVIFLAPLISHHWVKSEHLAPGVINQTLIIMGLSIALQWPYSLYYGGLNGLQRQVLLNTAIISFATIRSLGAVFILWKISPTIQAFFYWQMTIGVSQTVVVGILVWRQLPLTGKPARFRKQALARIWRFATGLTGISIAAISLTQLDKVVLSKILPLRDFGNYTLAGTVAGGLSFFLAPIFDGLFPRFSQLAALHDTLTMANLYHRSSQLVSVIILPMAVVICFFSMPLLYLWTGNPTIALNTHRTLSLLIMGSAFNSIMNLPYALQLAYGWTRLAFTFSVVASLLMIPLIIVLAFRYGAVAGGIVWLLINVSYFLININIMHTRILPQEKWRWYLFDVGLPFATAVLTAGLWKLLIPPAISRMWMFMNLGTVSSVTLAATVMTTPTTRQFVHEHLTRARTTWFGK